MSLPHAPHAAHFASLPVVLVQSISHMLQHADIIRLARCSRFTMQCADSAFAWICCPPLTLVRAPEAAIVPWGLLRFLPVSLEIVLSDVRQVESLFPLIAGLRVVQLCLGSVQLKDGVSMRLLTPPIRYRHLRSLQIALPSATMLGYVSALPALESLELYGPLEDPEVLQCLRDAPVLSRLCVSDTPSSAHRSQRSCLSVVSSFPSLRSLCVTNPAFHSEGSWLRFATAPCIAAHLTELRLCNWQPMKSTTAELGPAFAAMRALTALSFEYNNASNVPLRVLHHCPALTRLSFKNCNYSLRLLRTVLESMPRLHLELVSRIVMESGELALLESEQATLQAGFDTPRVSIKLT